MTLPAHRAALAIVLLLGLALPSRNAHAERNGPLARLEHALDAWYEGKLPRAEALLRDHLERFPDDGLARLRWGWCLWRLGRPQAALAALADAIPHLHTPETLIELGEQLRRADEPRLAARAFRRALELGPRSVLAHLGLGRALLEAGQPKLARAVLEHAARLPGDNPARLPGANPARLARALAESRLFEAAATNDRRTVLALAKADRARLGPLAAALARRMRDAAPASVEAAAGLAWGRTWLAIPPDLPPWPHEIARRNAAAFEAGLAARGDLLRGRKRRLALRARYAASLRTGPDTPDRQLAEASLHWEPLPPVVPAPGPPPADYSVGYRFRHDRTARHTLRNAHVLEGWITLPLTRKHRPRLETSVQRDRERATARHPAEDRDGWRLAAQLSLPLDLSPALYLAPELGLERHLRDGAAASLWAPRLALQLGGNLGRDIGLAWSAGLSWQQQRFLHHQPTLGRTRRRDTVWDASLRLARPVGLHLTLEAAYEFSHRHSNARPLRYTRHNVTIAVRLGF